MSIRISDMNKIPNSLKNLGKMNGKKLDVGVFGDGDMAMIAAVHEFGSPKNNIPERSFLRSGYDEHIDDISRKVDEFVPDVIEHGVDPTIFMEGLGKEFEGKIQKKLVALKNPPLKQSTIDRKGSSNPLVDTGNLAGSIKSRVT